MNEEIHALEANETWSLVPLPLSSFVLVVDGSTELNTTLW